MDTIAQKSDFPFWCGEGLHLVVTEPRRARATFDSLLQPAPNSDSSTKHTIKEPLRRAFLWYLLGGGSGC